MKNLENFSKSLLIVNCFVTIAFCHSGSLDSNNGHHSANGYHYHSGDGVSGGGYSGLSNFWDTGGANRLSQDDLFILIQRQRQLERLNALKEARQYARKTARTEARTRTRQQLNKKYVISRFLEFELINSAGAKNMYSARVRITTPKIHICRSDLFAIPSTLSKNRNTLIEILLESQEDDSSPWAELTCDESNKITLVLSSGLTLKEDLLMDPKSKTLRGTASYRFWSDSSKSNQTRAKLAGCYGNQLELICPDGTIVRIQVNNLGSTDLEFLESIRPDHSNRDSYVRFGTVRVLDVETLEFTDMRGISDNIHLHGLKSNLHTQDDGKRLLIDLVSSHPLVRVETTTEYGTEANVFAGKTWLNRELILRGFADVDPLAIVATEIKEAEEIARRRSEDIWGDR